MKDKELKLEETTILSHTESSSQLHFAYYESIKRELKTRPIYECRYDERLKTKAEEATRLAYTGLLGEPKRSFCEST
jgi:hypothetical protein